jgi:hypothetical protein
MGEVMGTGRATDFLREYAGELAEYVPSLKEFHKTQADKMPMSARLAFESGIEEYEARLRWARSSLAAYERGKKG